MPRFGRLSGRAQKCALNKGLMDRDRGLPAGGMSLRGDNSEAVEDTSGRVRPMIRDIVRYGDPRLLARNDEVETRRPRACRALLDDMFETCHAAPGIGLAAPQIGVNLRVAVIDLSVGADPEAVIVLVNPRSSSPPASRRRRRAACRSRTSPSASCGRPGCARGRREPRARSARCSRERASSPGPSATRSIT